MAKQGSRATTIAELEHVLDNFFDGTSRERGLAFEPRRSDIFISPYAKCGTTWLQQIAHGIRTGGSMDFDEISMVTPWIEVAHDVGWDLESEHVANPRVYKSHVSWHEIPKEARYIVSFRHPYDAILSFYRFFEGWFFEPGTINLGELLHWRWSRDKLESQGYWYHLSSWWEQKDNPDVLLLCYENMKLDLPGTVQKVADFMAINLDEAMFNKIVHQSSRDFMLAHSQHFTENYMHSIGGKRAGLPAPISNTKVTIGTPDKHRYHLSTELKSYMDEIWMKQITAKYGFKTYENLCQAMRELHNGN